MQFDCSVLTHKQQRNFMESIKDKGFEDSLYKVFFNPLTNEFHLVKIDYIVRNVVENKFRY